MPDFGDLPPKSRNGSARSNKMPPIGGKSRQSLASTRIDPDTAKANTLQSLSNASSRRMRGNGTASDAKSFSLWGWLFGRRSRRTPARRSPQRRSPTNLTSETLLRKPLQETDSQSAAGRSWRDASGQPSFAITDQARASRDRLSGSASLSDRRQQLLARRNARYSGRSLDAASRSPLRQELERASMQRNVRPRSWSLSATLYAIRMVILSVGIGVLAGTMLSVWDPASRAPAGASQQAMTATAAHNSTSQQAAKPSVQMPALGQEIAPLKPVLQAVVAKYAKQPPQMFPSMFFLDLDGNAFLDIDGDAAMAAASTIKVPVLIAFFQDVDAGKIRLDEQLEMRKELIAKESGDMQYKPVGTKFSALETVTAMITISDNTATNMLIARLGGIASLNQRFQSWGLSTTSLNNLLPDVEGTNVTSAKELAILMARISQGDLVSVRSRDRILEIMRKTENDSLLPQGLGKGATIAHKTGSIGKLLADVGLISLPNGRQYIAAVMVKRPHQDNRAYDLIHEISRSAYQYFSRSQEADNRTSPQPTSGGQTATAPEPANESVANR